MFKILQMTFATGTATVPYPNAQPVISEHFRGRPAFDFASWRDARPAAAVCPTGAIALRDQVSRRQVTVDYGLCIFCGQCADVTPDGGVRLTREFELAAESRGSLVLQAEYSLAADGSQLQLLHPPETVELQPGAGDALARRLGEGIRKVLGRALAIREVDAGSCNGCELEIVALNNPIHDLERFGIHFVASPRHADLLLVTGPVTRNMELALQKTYNATPDPKLVVAVGACGISGGLFGSNYACLGGVDNVVPVDVYIPGCPPRPEALLYGLLLAAGRLAGKEKTG